MGGLRGERAPAAPGDRPRLGQTFYRLRVPGCIGSSQTFGGATARSCPSPNLRRLDKYCTEWYSGNAASFPDPHLRPQVFIYGFSKNERSSIDTDELRALQEVAKELVGFGDRQLAAALAAGELMEIGGGNDQA